MNFEKKSIKYIIELDVLRKGIPHSINGLGTIGYGLKIKQSKDGKWHNKMIYQEKDLTYFTTHEMSEQEAYDLLELGVKNITHHLINKVGRGPISKLTVSQAAGIVAFIYHIGTNMEILYTLLKQEKLEEASLSIALTRTVKINNRIIPINISWRLMGSYSLISRHISRKKWKGIIIDLPPLNPNENFSELLSQILPGINFQKSPEAQTLPSYKANTQSNLKKDIRNSKDESTNTNSFDGRFLRLFPARNSMSLYAMVSNNVGQQPDFEIYQSLLQY